MQYDYLLCFKGVPACLRKGSLLFILLAVCTVSVRADFNFTNFSSTAGLNLIGNAARSGNVLRVTPSTSSQGGAAWYTTKQAVTDGFETTFDFQMTALGGIFPGGADGFAFVIQNNSVSVLGGLGGSIGYDGIANSLAVEFDTWTNSGEPNDNHISVQTGGTNPNRANHTFSIGSTTAIPDISDGSIHTVKIDYAPGSMSIFIDNLTTPVLTVSVNLASTLSLDNGKAWVGFTAATGAAFENHDILNWSFTETIPVITVSKTGDFGSGSTTPGAANVPFLQLNVVTDTGTATISDIQVSFTSTSTAVDADISAFEVYHDVDGDGTVSGGDTLLGSATFTGGVATVTGLSLNVTTTSSKLLLVLDIAANATHTHTVGLRLVASTSITTSTGTVANTNFPIANSLDQALPVELSAFTAKNTRDGVLLSWRTESEYQNLGFHLHRSETKDGPYQRIAWIDGAGSTPLGSDYQFRDRDVQAGQTYFYYLEDVDAQGIGTDSSVISVSVQNPRQRRSKVLSIHVQPPQLMRTESLPHQFRLLQNYPNPFNPETWLPYELSQNTDVQVVIFDAQGRVVRTLAIGKQRAGSYVDRERAAYWDGRSDTGELVGSGVYFYRLKAGNFYAIKKMLLLK